MVEPRPIVCVLLRAGMGGPHAWATRLRHRLEPTHQVLIGCHGLPGGTVSDPDHCFDDLEALGAWLHDLAPAIVLPNWLWEAYPVCDAVRAAGADLRVVGYCRSDDQRTYYEPLVRHHESCDWLVAVSERCRDGLRRRLPQRADRIRLIRTFVDGPERLQRDWQVGPMRLLYSGRLERLHKRVEDLAELAQALVTRDVDFELTIIGSGSSADQLQRRLSLPELRGRVRLLGQLAPDAMSSRYSASDIVVLVSDTEGLSNSVLEGMRHGCVPVVTRTSKELDNLLAGPLARGLVEVGDMQEMSARIAWLSTHPAQLSSLGHAAHRASADFAWSKYRPVFTSFLRDVWEAPAR